MRVLLINRNDFIDGGADRVFLNTVELLQVASCELQDATLAPSPATEGSAGESLSRLVGRVGGEVHRDAGVGVGTFDVDTFTRRSANLDMASDPRTLSVFGKLRLMGPYLYNRKVAKALDRKIRDFRPDVAHVHLIFGTLSISVLKVLKQHRVPVVMTLHDYRLICPANAMLDRHGLVCERCKGGRYYNCLIHRCSGGNLFFSAIIMLESWMRKYLYIPLKLVDYFIFVSQFALDKHLQSEPRYALKSSRLYNMTFPVPDQPAHRGDYLLYFGRLSSEKGILTLIEAANITGLQLKIAGSGPQEVELERTISERSESFTERSEVIREPQANCSPSGSEVILLGYRTGPDLEQLIRNCSFVVVPSVWYENNPMSVVEAFMHGKPVIGSRIGGIPELVTSETGFLFEPGNPDSLVGAIKKAVNLTDDEYISMSENCRGFARKNFDRDRHLSQLTGIYQQLVNHA